MVWQACCSLCRAGIDFMDRDASSESLAIVYANFFQVGHNAVEFLLDFGRQFEGSNEQMLVRVLTNPGHAKVLSNLLNRAIEQYEDRFGPIQNLAG